MLSKVALQQNELDIHVKHNSMTSTKEPGGNI